MPSAVKTSAEITAVMDKVFVYYKRDYQYQSNKKNQDSKNCTSEYSSSKSLNNCTVDKFYSTNTDCT